jgi:hypothetical protein
LFGLYGSEPDRRLRGVMHGLGLCAERQLAWHRSIEQTPRGSVRRLVGEQAYARFGELIGELMPPVPGGSDGGRVGHESLAGR